MKEDFYLNQINANLFSNFHFETRVNDVKLKNSHNPHDCRIIKKLVRRHYSTDKSVHAPALRVRG